MIKRVVLFIVATMVLMASLIGCGGGFEHDSDNAKNIEKSIFGPDSILSHNLAP
jgi:Na+/pantothenate symporter